MPNVTNHIQPLDQLFINYVKRLYKKWLNELLAKNDGGQPTKLTKINKIAELHASVPFFIWNNQGRVNLWVFENSYLFWIGRDLYRQPG